MFNLNRTPAMLAPGLLIFATYLDNHFSEHHVKILCKLCDHCILDLPQDLPFLSRFPIFTGFYQKMSEKIWNRIACYIHKLKPYVSVKRLISVAFIIMMWFSRTLSRVFIHYPYFVSFPFIYSSLKICISIYLDTLETKIQQFKFLRVYFLNIILP